MTQSKAKPKRLTFEVPNDLLRNLKADAKKENSGISFIVRRVLRQHYEGDKNA